MYRLLLLQELPEILTIQAGPYNPNSDRILELFNALYGLLDVVLVGDVFPALKMGYIHLGDIALGEAIKAG